MAFGVQLGTKYALIGGPRETGFMRRNLVTNPRGKVNMDGIATAPMAGVTAAPIAVGTAGIPGGFAGGIESTGVAVAAVTGVIGTFGRLASGLGTSAHPVIGGARYALRGSAMIKELTAGGMSALNLRVYWYTAAGASASVSNNTIQNVASPVVGTAYDFEGFATAPADAAFGVPRFLNTQTNPSSWVVRQAGVSMFEVDSAATFVPKYSDGDLPGWYWTGTAHGSEPAQDGTRAVLNDDTDPDFVGWAMEVTGLEGAEVRENFVDNIEADGAIHGEFYQGRRPVTITAAIGGNVTPTTRNARLGRWTAASRALRSRGVAHRPMALRWKPDGATEEMFTILRRQQRPTIGGLVLKEASIAMIAADPRIYGVHGKSAEHTPAGAGTAGRTYDRSYNVNFNWSAQRGTFSVTNLGDADAPVIIEFVNAMSTFALQNLTTEEEISINGSIVNGQTITVDTGAKTITLQDGTNLFDRIQLSRTRWWGLAPGANLLSYLAETFDASARVRVYHRPAWA